MPLTALSNYRSLAMLALLGLLAFGYGCASREERIQNVQSEANQALFEDDPAEAIEILRDGLDTFPDSNEIRIALSRVLLNAGNQSEAVELMKAAIEQDPTRDELWVKIGELEANLGNGAAAIEAFDAYLTNHGDDFLAWKAMSAEQEKVGNLTEAIKAALQWNNITPSAEPALRLGRLFLATSNIPQARSWFGQGAAYESGKAAQESLAELVKLETSLKQFQQASAWLSEYDQRYGTSNQDPRIRESRAVLQSWIRARQELAQAAAEIERERRELEEQSRQPAVPARETDEPQPALEADVAAEEPEPAPANETPEPQPTQERPPEELFGSAEPQPAAERETGAQPPPANDPTALTPLETAIAAQESGDHEHAISILWEQLGHNANNAQLWLQLSKAYYAQENWYDAEACILEARRRAPRSEAIAEQYARTIVKTQTTVRALEEIKALRLLFPRNAGIALTLAQALRDGNASRSVVSGAYRDFLAIASPNNAGYAEATRYLQNGN